MAWRLAESLKTLRSQIGELFPFRDKTSDGSIGDQSHKNRKSDHNPNAAGVVTAIDVDEDLATNIHSAKDLINAICASRDRRVKYIIYEKQITKKGSDLREWEAYHGKNPHDHHFHISVNSESRFYDDARKWNIGEAITPIEDRPKLIADLRIGDKGADVRALQVKLKITVDGDFGRGTRKAVIDFQHRNGLTADGIVGKNTRKKLGL